MAKIGPDPLWTALRAAGLADDSTRRVVIDVQSGHLPVVHTERYGDDGLLNVVAVTGRVEVVRDGPSPVPESPTEPLADPVAGSGQGRTSTDGYSGPARSRRLPSAWPCRRQWPLVEVRRRQPDHRLPLLPRNPRRDLRGGDPVNLARAKRRWKAWDRYEERS